jgi:repressor LexA
VIEILDGTARGLRLKEAAGLPLVGRVAAGSPILAEEHIIGRYAVDPHLFQPRADYLLKVRGMSMRDAGILDGDILAVHKTGEARSGQIVVARLHDEVTVKRLRRRGGTVELLPENPEFKTIVVDTRAEQFAIEGLAVGVIRNRAL